MRGNHGCPFTQAKLKTSSYVTETGLTDALSATKIELCAEIEAALKPYATKDVSCRLMNTLDHLLLVSNRAWNKLTIHDGKLVTPEGRIRALEERCGTSSH